ncbi:mitogen-activated protein kinase kinase kinase 1 [Arachis duranensis]|uniref:mitogen-activated protein kinase kinase kinase n=1 Tax=Arachis duranensis TaxID=130453 RepID=A0A6P4C0M2_ARADU|nr:mitogen-activated protein kinase kinase kinase 1 [Arachis duranensis]
MHHLPPFFNSSNRNQRSNNNSMDSKKLRRKPKLERRNAVKYVDYDADGSTTSSHDDSSSSVGGGSRSDSIYTRSMDFYDRTSFRIEGTEGEFDRICRSLGLSGPEDFAIPAAAWEAMKVRSSSDILPRLNPREERVPPRRSDVVAVGELAEEFEGGARVRVDETGGCCAESSSGVCGGIKGVRPPMLRPPPGTKVPVVDNTSSTWDLLRDFAPEGSDNGHLLQIEPDKEDEEEEEKQVVVVEEGGGKREEEVEERVDNAARIAEIVADLSGSCGFSTSNEEDDTSSTTTGPRSNNISPNGRIKCIITSGDWQKGELLGRGSFGSVYEGISGDGVFFAVKEVSLLDQDNQGKQSIYQLEQEIALLSQFEHENIVQYYGTETDESKLYIFLELVTKGSLASLYRRYTLRDSQVSAYTRQILHGLKYLHDRNVLHRDIKCANILVDANGSVKLADFGLAKATKLNDIKSCRGTPLWMAPEVVKGKNQGYGLPADMWSLGCTVLEMLTGKLPYSEFESMQALYRIGKGERPSMPDSLSKDARDFILQCLQVNPDHRPTAAQLLSHPFIQRPVSHSSGSFPNLPGKKG